MKQRLYTLHAAPTWRDTPNYPGVPAEPATVAKSTVRSQVDYSTFVNDHARRIAGYTFGAFTGVAFVIGSVLYVTAEWGVILIAIGFGMTAAGAAGAVTVRHAHNEWQRNGYGVSTTETYAPRKDAPLPTVRPFVASMDAPRTIRAGRMNLAPDVWRRLFNTVTEDGRLTRDRAVAAGLPRELYGDGAWGNTLDDLRRIGYLSTDNRLTEAGELFRDSLPRPDGDIAARTRIDRPTGDRPDVTGSGRGVGG